jgi:CHAT domain-containing protein
MGKFSEAESLLKLALEKMKDLNKEHFRVGEIFGLLGDIYVRGGKYAEAESMLNQSLEILSKVLGKDHSRVGTILQSLASLYSHTGKYAEAETLLKRSLEINERVFGKDHPEVARNNINLALLYAEMSRHHESHGMFTFGISIKDKNRENIFLLLPEKQKLNYFEKSKGGIHAFILHTALYMQTSDRAIRDTFDAWLRWKGSVTEAQGRYIDALTQSGNPEIQKKFEELNNLRRKIARLQLSGPGKKNPEEYEKGLEELERKKGPIEVELSSLSKDFALEKMVGRADTKRLSEILVKKGKNSVYIDFADIGGIYDFKEKKPGKSIYLAFVLLPEKEPLVKLINISDTEGVDKHIRTYLEEIKRSMEYGEVPRERILRSESRALYELLLKPIETEIKGKKHLYISPDGNLNLIPFEVLMTPEGKFLMEDYTISYIAAGRDIVRFADTNVARGEPLIMADPNYDMGLNEKTEVAKALGVIETRGPAPLSRDAKDLRFKRLPDTKQEADAIEKCLRESLKINVRNYQDKSALEEILLTAKSPRLLHLATHGYFLRDEEVKHQPMLGFMTQERERMVDIGIENPMLRSGIVLAGVNASLKEGRDDGVVSAEKILGLRLKGTDLVVLSACDTGTGEVKSGEGVFGLKRSFILSGAKTVVMSLWSIPSKETTELMTDFYTLMAKGKTKAEALREARLNLMKKKPNPFYWGAFIMVGNPN